MLPYAQLLAELLEPRVIQFHFAPLNQLPCARVVRALLDRKVDPADGDAIFALVVEDRLEGGDDADAADVEEDCFWGVLGGHLLCRVVRLGLR